MQAFHVQTSLAALSRSIARARLGLLALAIFILAAPLCAAATTYYVSPSGNDNNAGTLSAPFQTIQQAINNTSSGDTITLEDGTYTGPGDVDLDTLGKNLIFTSAHGAANAIIDCEGSSSANHRAFFIQNSDTVVINGLTMTNGYESNGNYNGGAIYADFGSALTLTGCLLINNFGIYGGAVFSNGTLTLTNCTVSGDAGTSIFSQYTVTLTNCIVSGNSDGGVSSYSSATLTGCTVSGNVGIGVSGGFLNNTTVTLTDCTVSDNGSGGIVDGYDAALTLTNCTISGNSTTGHGGGIDNEGNGTLINCLVADNSAQDKGGGIYNNGSLTLEFCTLSGNSAIGTNAQGGALWDTDATITLTDDILWNNAAPTSRDLYGQATATYCDIQSADDETSTFLDGTGDVSADPRFVNPNAGDFHLKPGSPAIGAGTSVSGVTTDLNGNTRPNPPTIGAYEGAYVPRADVVVHVLWNNTSGQVSLWTYAPSTGSYTYNNYGPFAGWTAQAIADGSDGKTRVLWTRTNGTMSLWNLDNTTGVYTHAEYGPYPNWTARSISVAAHNTTHVLWTNTNGQASLWNDDIVSGSYSHVEYGPFSTWTAEGIADGPDGKMRVRWNKTGGQASLWSLDNTLGEYSHGEYGPFSGWAAILLSVGGDNTTHVLWDNTDGQVSLWNYSTATGGYTYTNYGPFSGWSAHSLAEGADGKTRVLWNNTSGAMSLWGLDNTTGVYSHAEYGPFPGWTAVAVSAAR